jgi:sodium/bile acid cotransporter 3/5
MPLWFYTVGRTLSRKAEISIPFMRLIYNLLMTIFPCLFGVFLSRRFPQIKVFFMKYAKRVVLILIISFLSIILIAKYYVLRLVTWQQWVTGPLIPWSGFLLGGFVSWLFKRPPKQIYTITIETGMQNVGIAYMIVMLNFPSPESDYALLPLVAISCITTLPLWLILIVKTAHRKVNEYLLKRNDKDKQFNTQISNQNIIYKCKPEEIERLNPEKIGNSTIRGVGKEKDEKPKIPMK